MAVEPRRGCGYRKVNGLYLMTEGPFSGCHRLPIPLTICPTCGHGVKQSRGWTWVNPEDLFPKPHCVEDGYLSPNAYVEHCQFCAMCNPVRFKYTIERKHDEEGKPKEVTVIRKAGLLWIGEKFYPTPEHFMREADTMGISRRIHTVPHDFVAGKTWILMAHPKAVKIEENGEDRMGPGIIMGFRSDRIEKIITETQAKDEEAMKKLEKRGITPVIVPDNDPDHRGSVHDKEAA